MRYLLFFVAISMIGIVSGQRSQRAFADDGDAAKIKQPELAKELRLRVDTDQAARNEWIEYGTRHKTFDVDLSKLDPQIAEKFTALTNKLEDEDRKNRIWLKRVVQMHGWPGRSLVGTEGAHCAWLLVQHADRDREFQQECLTKMEVLPSGEVTPKELAFLTDRILSGTGKKQKYGTQALIKNGKLTFYPIDDEPHVDERRKTIGLGTLAEYREVMEKVYGISKASEPEAEK